MTTYLFDRYDLANILVENYRQDSYGNWNMQFAGTTLIDKVGFFYI